MFQVLIGRLVTNQLNYREFSYDYWFQVLIGRLVTSLFVRRIRFVLFVFQVLIGRLVTFFCLLIFISYIGFKSL